MSQNSTKVRVDELHLLTVGIGRSLKLYGDDLEIKISNGYLQLGDVNTGEICQIKLGDNVIFKED